MAWCNTNPLAGEAEALISIVKAFCERANVNNALGSYYTIYPPFCTDDGSGNYVLDDQWLEYIHLPNSYAEDWEEDIFSHSVYYILYDLFQIFAGSEWFGINFSLAAGETIGVQDREVAEGGNRFTTKIFSWLSNELGTTVTTTTQAMRELNFRPCGQVIDILYRLLNLWIYIPTSNGGLNWQYRYSETAPWQPGNGYDGGVYGKWYDYASMEFQARLDPQKPWAEYYNGQTIDPDRLLATVCIVDNTGFLTPDFFGMPLANGYNYLDRTFVQTYANELSTILQFQGADPYDKYSRGFAASNYVSILDISSLLTFYDP